MKYVLVFLGVILPFFVLAQDCRFGAPVLDVTFVVSNNKVKHIIAKEGDVVNHFSDIFTLDSLLTRLHEGGHYTLRLFPVITPVSGNDVFKFLIDQKAVLLGSQGLVLLYDWFKHLLPINKRILSFDKRALLPRKPAAPFDGSSFTLMIPSAELEDERGSRYYCLSLARFESIPQGSLVLCVTRQY